jgi:hypothetical protein
VIEVVYRWWFRSSRAGLSRWGHWHRDVVRSETPADMPDAVLPPVSSLCADTRAGASRPGVVKVSVAAGPEFWPHVGGDHDGGGAALPGPGIFGLLGMACTEVAGNARAQARAAASTSRSRERETRPWASTTETSLVFIPSMEEEVRCTDAPNPGRHIEGHAIVCRDEALTWSGRSLARRRRCPWGIASRTEALLTPFTASIVGELAFDRALSGDVPAGTRCRDAHLVVSSE